MRVVDPVSRPIVDAHFQNALTNASAVAGISYLHATNAAGNACDGIGIPEAAELARKLISLTYLGHESVL